MKLTKKKLEQLITEEYARAVGDEYKSTNYPEYSDKLSNLAKQNYPQARELADALDEPIDIKYDPDQEQIRMRSHRSDIDDLFDADHDLHFDFLMDGGASSFEEEPDIQEMYEFAIRKGLDPQKTRNSIMKNYKNMMMRMFVTPETQSDRMRRVHDLTGGGFGYTRDQIKDFKVD